MAEFQIRQIPSHIQEIRTRCRMHVTKREIIFTIRFDVTKFNSALKRVADRFQHFSETLEHMIHKNHSVGNPITWSDTVQVTIHTQPDNEQNT